MGAAGALAAVAATLLSAQPAYYPVPFLVTNGSALTAYATMEKPTGATRRISLLVRNDTGGGGGGGGEGEGPWAFVADVVTDATPGVDLANGFCVQTPADWYPGLVCAYRHHVPAPGGGTQYRLRVSRSGDGGATWAVAGTITQGAVGVWEPFLYLARSPAGGRLLRVVYAGELTNGGEQDIVQRESADGGATWGPVTARIHTPGSRNGMPGVAALPDGSLVVVMEGFWTGVWGAFTVGLARSFDGGATWGQRTLVHAPPAGSNCHAGAPKVAVCPPPSPGAGPATVVVGFMDDEPADGSGRCPAVSVWPSNATLALKAAVVDASNASAPLNFTGSPLVRVPTVAPTAVWPALFADVTADGAAGPASAGAGALRIAYQSPGDGPQAPPPGAYLSDGSLCELVAAAAAAKTAAAAGRT
jgi:hypothetical protein